MGEETKPKADMSIVDRAAGWSVVVNASGLAVNVLSALDRGQSYELANAIHNAATRLPAPPMPQAWGGSGIHVNASQPF